MQQDQELAENRIIGPNIEKLLGGNSFIDEHACIEALKHADLKDLGSVHSLFSDFIIADLPNAAKNLVENTELPDSVYLSWLMRGIVFMMHDELEKAEESLLKAHALEPEEVSIHVNLSQLYLEQERDEDTQKWAKAGLELSPNHFQLWESLYLSNPESVLDIAKDLRSWVGLHLFGAVNYQDAIEKQVDLLKSVFEYYQNDEDYLIEYTALLGMTSQFDEITSIGWSADRTGNLHWRLAMHTSQAYSEKDDAEQAIKFIKKAMRHNEIPPSVKQELSEEVKRYESH